MAQQRLDDFRMANFLGPLPRDPLLGGDARTRAQARIELQRQLEQGSLGFPPMNRDDATRLMSQGESLKRVAITRDAYSALIAEGMSAEGAIYFLNEVASNGGPALAGLEGYGVNVVQPGRQPLPTDVLSASDAAVLKRVLGPVGTVADIAQLGIAFDEMLTDTQDENRYKEFGGEVGSVLGGAGGTAFALATTAAFSNPVTALIAAGVFVYLASEVGESVGGTVGGAFDVPR